jgi:hypothetical protein
VYATFGPLRSGQSLAVIGHVDRRGTSARLTVLWAAPASPPG